MELIRLERAEIGYGRPLLAPLDLSIRAGDRLAVLGPNGGGKSTLLKSLLGLQPLLSGKRVVPEGDGLRLGYVPQAHRVDPIYPLSVLQVTVQGRYGLVGVGRFVGSKDKEAARTQLAKVGMLDHASRPFRALSGGQRQRVLLARALCGDPQLLVLDEFTSDLDPAASSALLGEVSRLATDAGVSVLFVTHEPSAAAAYASSVAMVDSRRGVFDAGPRSQMLTSERLTRLYGQPVRVEKREGRTVIYVESGVEPGPELEPGTGPG